MINKLRGEVEVTIDGTSCTLVYNVNAIVAVEQALGRSISALDSLDNLDFASLLAFVWAGLRTKNPEFSKERLGGLLPADLLALAPYVGEAITAAFPQAAGGQGAANPRKRPGTGSSS